VEQALQLFIPAAIAAVYGALAEHFAHAPDPPGQVGNEIVAQLFQALGRLAGCSG